jgi:hypothetical protein
MEIIALILIVPLTFITLIALFAAVTLLIPVPIAKTRIILEEHLFRPLLVGLINFIFFTALAVLFGWLAERTIPGLNGVFILLVALIILALLIFSLIGLLAFAQMLGDRIGIGKTPFTSHLLGSALLLLASLAPYIGWFLFTPIILWTSLGAGIITFVQRREKSSSV